MMAFVNVARRELQCKIVYYGPGYGGKTTNLEQLHRRLPPERRGRLTSLKTADERTLFFDLLPLDLGTVRGLRTRFQLYTVPGQPRYDLSRRVVLRGADGIVFVADSDPRAFLRNRQSLDNLRANLARYGRALESVPFVLQLNKRDVEHAVARTQLERLLNATGRPTIEAVAVRDVGVTETLRTVIRVVLTRLTQRAADPQVCAG